MTYLLEFFLPLTGVVILIFLLTLQYGIDRGVFRSASNATPEEHAADEVHRNVNETRLSPVADAIHTYRRRRETDERQRAQRDRVTIIVSTATAIFAFFAAGAAIFSAWIFSGQLDEMHQASVAAIRSAEVAQRALEGVERPVLLISPPRYTTLPANQTGLDPNRTTYGFFVENIRKQIATLMLGDYYYVITRDPISPSYTFMNHRNAVGICSIFILEQLVIKPNNQQAFVCQRMVELTVKQIDDLNNETVFGFFNIGFEYTDPVGTIRNSYCIFLQRPPINLGYFIQVMCGDRLENQAITDQQKEEVHRKLMGSLIEIQRDIDRREGKIKPPDEAPH